MNVLSEESDVDHSDEFTKDSDYVDTLRRLMDSNLCSDLECVFFSASNVLSTHGRAIHEAFPHLTVIGFSTIVEPGAAVSCPKKT